MAECAVIPREAESNKSLAGRTPPVEYVKRISPEQQQIKMNLADLFT